MLDRTGLAGLDWTGRPGCSQGKVRYVPALDHTMSTSSFRDASFTHGGEDISPLSEHTIILKI